MECRQLEITVISAQNLENVRQFFKNSVRVYAKISVGGNPATEKKTPVDEEGQTNPVWKSPAAYTVGLNALKSTDIRLLVQFFCVRTYQETNIGEVSVSLAELFDSFSKLSPGGGGGEGTAKVTYPVKKGDANSQGEVSLSYKIGDVFTFAPPSVDWGQVCWKGTKLTAKVCWKGTKLVAKGGMLCFRLTMLVNGSIFDMPIDAIADVAQSSYDILSSVVVGAGDLLADISCPGSDVPLVVDTTCT